MNKLENIIEESLLHSASGHQRVYLVSPGTHLRVPQKAYHPDALFRGLFHG